MKVNAKALTAFLLLAGCASRTGNTGEVYVADVDSRSWKKGMPVYMYMDNTDTLSLKNLGVIVRFTDGFAYDRLLLTVETLSPERISWSDTLSVEFTPADNFTEYSEISKPLRGAARFNKAGNYRFAVRHLMPEVDLSGVAGLGIEIK